MPIYGRLSRAQREALAPHVRGRVVHDLGAGACHLSREMAELGAAHVVAIDVRPPPRHALHSEVSYVRASFHDVSGALDIALVSWPVQDGFCGCCGFTGSRCLVRALRGAHTVVYLGRNGGGVWCGGPALFEHFMERPLLAHVPARRNDLLVLGEWHRGCDVRAPTPQEARVLSGAAG